MKTYNDIFCECFHLLDGEVKKDGEIQTVECAECAEEIKWKYFNRDQVICFEGHYHEWCFNELLFREFQNDKSK